MKKKSIEKFLQQFKPGENLKKPDETILNFGKQTLPEEIIYLWENYGFGDYGNGIIKIIDPRDYMNSLYTWLGKQDFHKIPIILTAFGDIFYYRKLDENENDVSLLNVHYRRVENCGYSYQEFFQKYIVDEDVIKNILRKDLYKEAVSKLGALKEEEIFYFVPALVLGGGENIKYIQKGKANVHHQVLLKIKQ